MRNKYRAIWFLIGLGTSLQIVASLSITEAVVLFTAPFIFVKHFREMKRDGVSVFFYLSLMVLCGCLIACVANHTPRLYALRGCAVTSIIPCSIIFGHWILRRDPAGFKWMLVGAAISMVLCTFVFQRSVEVTLYAEGSKNAADIASGQLFWIQRLGSFVMLPTRGWYLHTPIWFDVPAMLFMAVFAVTTSTSGRSAALSALAAVCILLIGGKRQRTMRRLSRHFITLAIVAICFVFVSHFIYRIAATSGWIGETQRTKYEQQSQGSSSIIRLIMGGRAESFVGLLACRDKPIIGWGPWAMDRDGYWEEYISRFGTQEDVEMLQRVIIYNAKMGYDFGFRLIAGHSHITMFWLWYGIWGLIFWLYVIFVIVRFVKNDAWVVPQWYAWLACATPGIMWDILFSPFANRVGTPIMIVACLMARAVRRGKFELPASMLLEANKKSGV